MPRRSLALLLTAALAVAVAACGGDDDGDASRTTSSTASSSSSTTSTIAASTTSTTAAPSTTVGSAAASTTTVTRGSTVTVQPDPTAPPPAYESHIATVTAKDLYASWRAGCPVPVEELRAIDLSYWGFDGRVHQGRIIVSRVEATHVAAIFGDLYENKYPIEKMVPIDAYGGDDNKSIKANNTSGFNCRNATGGSTWSEHAYGRAIDLNPFTNPYVKGSTVLPPEAAKYTDRSRTDPGMIHAGDATVQAFASRGWKWGGYWSSLKDYQHFSTTGK